MARFFPEYAHHLTEEKGRITLKHLLTMTAGFNWDQSGAHNSEPGSLNSEAQMENASDFIEYVLSRELSDEPGSRFNYNSGCFILLAGVIKRASGMHVDKFADKYLFAPLGIDHSEWWYTKNGLPQTHAGLRLRPRDMAKIGQLYVDNGRFHGRQVVSAAWISESAKGHYGNDRYGLAGGSIIFHTAGDQLTFLLPKETAVSSSSLSQSCLWSSSSRVANTAHL